jgi:hypothetical protein
VLNHGNSENPWNLKDGRNERRWREFGDIWDKSESLELYLDVKTTEKLEYFST